MLLNQITEMIMAKTKDGPIIIGIEGFGGSGKSTLAAQFKELLGNAYVIHIDDYIVKSKLAEPAWDTGVFDHHRLEEQVLKPALSGEKIIYQKLIYDSDTLSEPATRPIVTYLIIEGISCFIPKLSNYYDFKIWVNTPINIAKKRGQERKGTHGSAKDWEAWAAIDIRYQQKYHPELIADFIVENE
jgi:uridine kinase